MGERPARGASATFPMGELPAQSVFATFPMGELPAQSVFATFPMGELPAQSVFATFPMGELPAQSVSATFPTCEPLPPRLSPEPAPLHAPARTCCMLQPAPRPFPQSLSPPCPGVHRSLFRAQTRKPVNNTAHDGWHPFIEGLPLARPSTDNGRFCPAAGADT
jgi:hypothetical protein